MSTNQESSPVDRGDPKSDSPIDKKRVSLVAGNNAGARIDAAAEWKKTLTGITLGLLLFETITGFFIYFLPFSVFNQFGVLWHTVIGVLMIAPVGWYTAVHWWVRFRGKFNHYQLLGYVSAIILIALFVSGFVLTWQAIFGVRISYTWDLIHLITGFVFVFAILSHTAMLWVRKVFAEDAARSLASAKRAFLTKTGAVTCVLLRAEPGADRKPMGL